MKRRYLDLDLAKLHLDPADLRLRFCLEEREESREGADGESWERMSDPKTLRQLYIGPIERNGSRAGLRRINIGGLIVCLSPKMDLQRQAL